MDTYFTNYYRKKIASSAAEGTELPKIVKMAFGDGGLNSDGSVRKETGEETSLYNELQQKNINGHTFSEDGMSVTVTCALEKNEQNGKSITEIGLIDESGGLAGIKFCEPQKKDADFRYIFELECKF